MSFFEEQDCLANLLKKKHENTWTTRFAVVNSRHLLAENMTDEAFARP